MLRCPFPIRRFQLLMREFQHQKCLSIARFNMAADGSSNLMAESTDNCKQEKQDDMDKRIIWVDLEMSGLDPEIHRIVEMAVIVTDGDLNVIAESPNIVIHQTEDVIENMSDWCKETFAKSGLVNEIRASTNSTHSVQQLMLDFLRQHTVHQKCVLAGNSVYMDRIFLRKHMPEFEDYLHYRILDVSVLKELSRRWYPEIYENQPKKKCIHRALSDIRESIEELKWYRSNIFRSA